MDETLIQFLSPSQHWPVTSPVDRSERYAYMESAVYSAVQLPGDIAVIEWNDPVHREAFEREWMRLTGDFRMGTTPRTYS